MSKTTHLGMHRLSIAWRSSSTCYRKKMLNTRTFTSTTKAFKGLKKETTFFVIEKDLSIKTLPLQCVNVDLLFICRLRAFNSQTAENIVLRGEKFVISLHVLVLDALWESKTSYRN